MTEILILLGVIAVIGLILAIKFSGMGFFTALMGLVTYPFLMVWHWWTNRK